MPHCEMEVRHVRLLGQRPARPARPEIVTVDDSSAFGHPPDPLRVGVEILIVRRWAGELHLCRLLRILAPHPSVAAETMKRQ
jgi:hypothetical protein